jgi:heterodisulfide reductase subunit A2
MSHLTDKNVVIIGGGVAGLAVAKSLANNGISSTIVERDDRLGGRVRQWACMATDRCLRCFACIVQDLVDEVTSLPEVKILHECELASVERSEGVIEKITVRSLNGGAERVLNADALVLATGFDPYDPSEKIFWGYGSSKGVLTLAEMDSYVRNDDLAGFAENVAEPLRVAFFQCIGSRDRSIGANYCSQYCCQAALRMALRLRHARPDWDITIFYIDLQIAGKLAGHLLADAADKSIRLVQGVPGEIVEGDEGILQVVREAGGRNVRESYHRVVLSVGQRPSDSSREMAALTGLSLDDFGFLAPSGLTDPSRTAAGGIYLAGTCAGPKGIEATLEHAGQATEAVIEDLEFT